MNNHYNCIYMYVDKINGKCYIGQAKDFNKRHSKHLHSSKSKNDKDYKLPIHNAIRKYGIDNFNIIILKENLDTQCLLNLYECYYIKKDNTLSKNNNGYNISSGGSNGNNFAGKTEEEMNEMKERWKNNENRKYWKGKNIPTEIKNKMSESNKKIRGKKILQYTLDMVFIKEWDCIRDIERELKIANQNISKCCKGKRKTAGGFIWRYKKE